MPLWLWALIVVAAMLAFGLAFDVRRTRRLMLGSSRKARRAALAERHRLPTGAALVFDGIFLHRPELRDGWDYTDLAAPFVVGDRAEFTSARRFSRDTVTR